MMMTTTCKVALALLIHSLSLTTVSSLDGEYVQVNMSNSITSSYICLGVCVCVCDLTVDTIISLNMLVFANRDDNKLYRIV